MLEAPVADLCSPHEVTRSVAIGDIDRDGDVDLLLSNIHGPSRLYRNDTPREGRWLAIRAVDPRLRRDAIGARVVVSAGGREFHRTVSGGFGYLSSSPPVVHLGIGDAERADSIEVRWPDGMRERFPSGPVDRTLTLVRGEGESP